MGPTLDDLRQPNFGGRVWGYDRDEVDQLLASVITSIERLQRRRKRDAATIDKAADELAQATARAERAERERAELAIRLEFALEATAQRRGDDRGGDDRGDIGETVAEAERLVAEAAERADRAERQVLGLREELADQRARTGRVEAAEAEIRELRAELEDASEGAPGGEAGDSVFPSAHSGAAHPYEPPGDGALVPAHGRLVRVSFVDDEELSAEVYARLPLAQRAARALLREARARAAAIVAEAEERARVS